MHRSSFKPFVLPGSFKADQRMHRLFVALQHAHIGIHGLPQMTFFLVFIGINDAQGTEPVVLCA